jgi:hypothetical protein
MHRGIDLHGQPSFGEFHLNLNARPFSGRPYLGFMLAQQIVDELLARIIPNPVGWYIRLKAEGNITACLTGACA